MRVYLKNHGQSHLPETQRRPYQLPGWHTAIPVGEQLEITDDLLRYMARPTGPDAAQEFATFAAGVVNANREPWLEVVVVNEQTDPPVATGPKQDQTPATPPPDPVVPPTEPAPETDAEPLSTDPAGETA